MGYQWLSEPFETWACKHKSLKQQQFLRKSKVLVQVTGWLFLLLSAGCFGFFEADLDEDCTVGLGDLCQVAEYWLDHGHPGCLGDTGSDCRVDMADIAQLAAQWQWMECNTTAAASSVESDAYPAANAIDGNMDSRWSSAFQDNQWLQLDLGLLRHVYGLTIHWEDAYARVYNIQASADGSDWDTLFAEPNGNGGTDAITFPEQTLRYLRINCITRALPYGSSIYEVELKSDDGCRQVETEEPLAWSDEFDGPAIDTSNWNWETGTGSNGWGNNEWEYYTNHPDNSYIENGKLVIAARKNQLGHDYTSARLTTKNKQVFRYGRMEARIKLPAGGKGIWPAFWMLGANIGSAGWPACGEIDIMEAVNDFTEISGALHYGSSDPYVHNYRSQGYDPHLDVSADYHVYAVEWEPTEIRWYFDEQLYFRRTDWWTNTGPFPAPFDEPFFFILNVAVGGNWPGYPDETTPFPQLMYVDYVRVYQTAAP